MLTSGMVAWAAQITYGKLKNLKTGVSSDVELCIFSFRKYALTLKLFELIPPVRRNDLCLSAIFAYQVFEVVNNLFPAQG